MDGLQAGYYRYTGDIGGLEPLLGIGELWAQDSIHATRSLGARQSVFRSLKKSMNSFSGNTVLDGVAFGQMASAIRVQAL